MAVNLNIPSQVKPYANLAAFPATGAVKTIYIAEDTNKTYRWTGSAYVEISATAASTWGGITGTLSNQTDLQNALNAKENTITAGTTSQYFRGDKTFQTLDKTAVGLGNVDNTSDANKPISTATQTALNAKQDTLVSGTNIKTINGTSVLGSGDISISTGLTIGTTPITSGTIGRVLFQGTGNVLQQSSSLFWDNSANRFQVGSNVNILAANTFPTNVNSPYVVLGPYNASFGGDQGALFNLTNNNTTGNAAAIFRFGMTAPATGAIGEFGATSSTFSGFPSLVFFNTKGTFPLAFLTNDTERLRIHGSTGNVLINTTTDAGFKLDVNGTARVQGLTTIRTSASSYNNPLLVENTGSAAVDNKNVAIFIGARGNASNIDDNTNIGIWQKSNIVNNYGVLSFYNSAGNLSAYFGTQFVNHGASPTGNLLFGTVSSGVPATRMTIFSTGNVGINTATDAGFLLDVNGTARVQGNAQFGTGFYWDNTNARVGIGTSTPSRALDIVKTIASGATEGIKIEVNHSSSTSAAILDFVHTQFDARFRLQSIAGAGGANPTLSFIVRSSTLAMSILQSGNVNIGSSTTDAGFRLDVNGTARVQGDLTSTGIISAQSRFTQLGSNANTFPGIINHMGAAQSVTGLNTTRICANTDLSVGFAGGADASAVIEARSTTKGFLPPRMTTTQKNAISTPATGLQVFDTTLNQMSYYNGTTWINL